MDAHTEEIEPLEDYFIPTTVMEEDEARELLDEVEEILEDS